MKYHHTSPTLLEGATHCNICGEKFVTYWKDASEKNGQSDTTTKRDGKIVHYSCAGGKSLQQLNEERKQQ